MDLNKAGLGERVAEEGTHPSLKPENDQVGLKGVSNVSKNVSQNVPQNVSQKHPKTHLKMYLKKILPEDGLVGRGAKVEHPVVQAGVLVHLEKKQL